jgi:hypothetical protein
VEPQVSPPVAAAAREVTLSITGTAQKTAPAAALFLRMLRRLIWLSVVLKAAFDPRARYSGRIYHREWDKYSRFGVRRRSLVSM